jgi:hypothetical protein
MHIVVSTSYKILSNVLSRLRPCTGKITEAHQCGFDITDSLLGRLLHSSDSGEKNVSRMGQYISYL